MIDIRRAVEFLTEDEKAPTKLGIGALLMAIPVANVIAVGYEVETTRRVVRGEPRPLPEWADLSNYFISGVWLTLARLVYALPIFVIVVVGFASWAALIYQLAASNQDAPPSFGALNLILLLCFIGVVFAYSLVFGFASPAILAQYARYGTFAACFNFSAILAFIRRDPGQYALAWLAEVGLGLVLGLIAMTAGFVLGVIPCLGSLASLFVFGLAAFLIILFNSHLVGQLMRAAEPLAGSA